jgi:hypothetical protein
MDSTRGLSLQYDIQVAEASVRVTPEPKYATRRRSFENLRSIVNRSRHSSTWCRLATDYQGRMSSSPWQRDSEALLASVLVFMVITKVESGKTEI